MTEIKIYRLCTDCEGTGYLVCSECDGMGTGDPCQMCEGESWEEICGVCDGQGERPIDVREWFEKEIPEATIAQIETDEATEIMIFFAFGDEFEFDAKARIEKIKDAARGLQLPIIAIQGYDDRAKAFFVQVVTFEILGVKVKADGMDD